MSLWFILSLVFFALGLMSKPAVVTLPCVMLLLDYWPLGRVRFDSRFMLQVSRLVLEKVPFFAMAGVLAWITVQSHAGLGLTQTVHGLPLPLRIENALVAYASYVTKAIWPARLAVLYPHPGEWPEMVVIGSLLLVCAVMALAIWQVRRRPYLFVGWFWFLGVLVPTIGILQIGVQAMADRFAYVPLIGLFIMVVWGGWEFVVRAFGEQPAKRIAGAMGVAGMAAYAIVASNQLSHWRNSIALFQHALAVTKDNFVVANNLGYTLMQQGRTNDALPYLEMSLRIRPDMAPAAFQAGEANEALGRLENALLFYKRAAELEPESTMTRARYADALRKSGNVCEAIQEYRAALQMRPDSPELLNNLAWLLATHPTDAVRNGGEAVRLAERACELTQRKAPMFLGTLAAAYAEAGRFGEAVKTGQEAAVRAEELGESDLAARNRELAEQYAENTPYRDR